MNPPDPVRLARTVQREAARPDTSVALRASAGSGKTRVLIDRFIRLCVEGVHNDTHPRSILAITFTRKAATEIRERLLDRARRLALGTDDVRAAALADLFAGRPDPTPRPGEIDRAARLYEKLLEDTGGLQVGTIHSFCQRILARFATEAGLDPHARILEEKSGLEDLVDEALDRIEVLVAADSALTGLAQDIGATPGAVRAALRDVFKQQVRLERWVRRVADRTGAEPKPRRPLAPAMLAEVRAFLFGTADLPEELAPADFMPDLAAALDDLAGPGLAGVVEDLGPEVADRVAKGLDQLRTLVETARAAAAAGDVDDAVNAARAVLLTGGGKVRAFTLVRDAEIKAAMKTAVLERARPLVGILRRLDLVGLYRRNRAQLTLGLRALDVLDDFKRRDRVVDFGDLEDMACVLMGDRARALSLLFRLEDSIRHVLVDEFQDTNFNQQDILAPFVGEFLGGGGSAEGAGPPTVFLVGDMKQSIYGFRGAEPAIFASAVAEFQQRDLPTPTLPTNFRSLDAVVSGVGSLFGAEPLVSNLPPGEAAHVRQEVARREDPGVLVLRGAYPAAEDGRSADQVAAAAAAALVRELVDGGTTTWEGYDPPLERPLAWRDVLVLYRSRTGVSLYEQAFRAAGIPIEPAGRGMLAAGREVQDILALLRWLVWPDDDAALATVLRSPVFRLSEQAFQELAAERGLFRVGPEGPEGRPLPPRTLWWALRRHAGGEGPLAACADLLSRWRGATGLVGCHELLRRIYRDGDVLARYEATGQPQARVNLERLFDLALGSEVAGTPTVRHFIDLVDKAGRRGGQDEGTAPVIEGAGRVRFMTIHGAKGLEAPVVLLVDADRALTDRSTEVRLNPSDDTTGLVFGARQALRRGIEGAEDVLDPDLLQAAAAEAAAATAVEDNNLLYVALTRARDRLYLIGGKSSAKDEDQRTFLARARAAAEQASGPVACEDPAVPPPPAPGAASGTTEARTDVRIWEPPAMGERLRTVLPSSDLGPPPVPAGGPLPPPDPELSPRDYGLLVHRLLEAAAVTGAVPAGDSVAHVEARAVFGDAGLAWIFDPDAHERGLVEVPVIHRTREGGPAAVEERTTGVIDRLVLRPGRVDVVDYKTNRLGTDPAYRDALVAHYRPQMKAYRAAARALFPDREVHAWLLFTDPRSGGLVPLDSGGSPEDS